MRRNGGKRSNPYRRPDHFTRRAKEEGYAARSVYKLDEIQRRFRVLERGQRVLDLGCSPGSWSRYAQQVVGPGGRVVGVDLQQPEDPVGIVIVRSVCDVTPVELREALEGSADVVLCDMAPLTTGDPLGDHVAQLELAGRAAELAFELLRPGGHFVTKVFEGEDAPAFVQGLRPRFERIKRVRPEAVRRVSREFFVVAMGYRASG